MFARQYGGPERERTHSSASNTALYPPDRKHVAWRQIRDVLSKQWRSIVTAFMVANLTIFFGLVSIQDTAASQAPLIGNSDVPKSLDWITCLMESDGNKTSCLSGAPRLGIAESRATATFLLAAVSLGNISLQGIQRSDLEQFFGIIVPALLVRRSMFEGWKSLLRDYKEQAMRLLRRCKLAIVGYSRHIS